MLQNKETSLMIQQKKGFWKKSPWKKTGTFLLYVSPALIWFLLIMGWPLVNMFRVSLLDWRFIFKPATFVGFENYIDLFTSEKLVVSIKNTVIYLVVLESVVLPVSFILGYFLSLKKPGHLFFRTLFFLPVMISTPALAMMFLGTLSPDGALNFILNSIGLESLARVWLANTSTALGTIIAVDIWGAIGFFSVLMFGSISDISPEVIEAAKVDGANTWILIWKIIFPMVSDIIGVCAMFMFVGSLTQVQFSLLLTKGGPGYATYTLGYYLYDMAFQTHNLGLSQAIGVFVFVVGILGTLIIRRIFRPRY